MIIASSYLYARKLKESFLSSVMKIQFPFITYSLHTSKIRDTPSSCFKIPLDISFIKGLLIAANFVSANVTHVVSLEHVKTFHANISKIFAIRSSSITLEFAGHADSVEWADFRPARRGVEFKPKSAKLSAAHPFPTLRSSLSSTPRASLSSLLISKGCI